MAASRILVVLIILCYVLLVGTSDGAVVENAFREAQCTNSPLEPEIEQLRSKISSLDSCVSDRTNELRRKDGIIQGLEKILDEKSSAIESLQLEIVSLQKRGTIDAQKLLRKADTRARELEKQIDGFMNELRAQSKKREDFEAWAAKAEKEIHELGLKVEILETKNDEQQCRVQETQHALKLLEEELAKTQLVAKLASDKLVEVYQAWLPIGFANYLSCCLSWIPSVEQLKIFSSYIGLHMRCSSNKFVEAYEICQAFMVPHAQKLQELVDSYFQRAKKHWEPNISWIASIMKSRVEKVHLFFKQYTKQPACAYKKFINSVIIYHHQVQAAILQVLERHEASKPLATKYLIWSMATALLVSPIFIIYRLFSAFCGEKWRIRQRTRMSRVSRRQKSKHVNKGSRVH